MKCRVMFRDAKAADQKAIHGLIEAAFDQKAEADLVDQLNADGDMVISLVAENATGDLLGHVALSKLKSPPSALALAPVSVAPDEQSKGIGSALIRDAIERARVLGAELIFVLGDPAFYTRFGFSVDAARPYPCPYAGPYFMALLLSQTANKNAPLIYPTAFSNL